MITHYSYLLRLFADAIFIIALCAGCTGASAQNTVNSMPSESAMVQGERERITTERKTALQAFEQRKQACYQKLSVTPCLNDARDQHGEQMRNLKRQEVTLNTEQRKRAASQRIGSLDDRNSPQAQLEQAQRRGRALMQSKERETAAAEKARARAAKQAASNAAPPQQAMPAAGSATHSSAATPQPQGKPRAERSAADSAAKPRIDAAERGRSRQRATQRELDAAQRKALAADREAKRTKSAAPLPIPKI
jgi:colicin import membrane protein